PAPMHRPGRAADGFRQRLPRAARAGPDAGGRSAFPRGAQGHPLEPPGVRARGARRGGLGCLPNFQVFERPGPPPGRVLDTAVPARRRQRGARLAAAARGRAQRGRGASARRPRRAKLFFLPRLAHSLTTQVLSGGLTQRVRAFYALTTSRVVSLIVFTAVIGMFLATPAMVPAQILIAGTLGIAFVAG